MSWDGASHYSNALSHAGHYLRTRREVIARWSAEWEEKGHLAPFLFLSHCTLAEYGLLRTELPYGVNQLNTTLDKRRR